MLDIEETRYYLILKSCLGNHHLKKCSEVQITYVLNMNFLHFTKTLNKYSK